MERKEWLKVVYEAACRVAEKHGPGLRSAVESKDDDGALSGEIFEVASRTVAAHREIWPFLQHSRHPEPSDDGWRRAGSFEGAVVQAAVAALGADIRDIIEGLSTGRVPNLAAEGPAGGGGEAENSRC